MAHFVYALVTLQAVLLAQLVLAGFSAPQSVDCQSPPQNSYPFCNTSLSFEERTTDLVNRLTVEELINQTVSMASAIPRLGMNAYSYRGNCLHGWSVAPDTWPPNTYWTVFPNPMGMGASWDFNNVLRAGQITSDEGRALHNVNLAYYNGTSPDASALNCFSPNVNIYRSPLWGRNMETYGEDNFHMSRMGLAYTMGMQLGNNTTPNKYLKIGACTKHFAAHDGPDDTRTTFVANVSTHDLFDTYLASTEAQVYSGNVAQLMAAYSGLKSPGSMNSAPDCANQYLLITVLRETFGAANISVTSDAFAIPEVYQTHHFVDSLVLAAAVSINATTDLDLRSETYSQYLPQAVSEGLVSVETIKNSVWRSLYLRMKVGDFDPPDMVEYQSIGPDHLNTPENQAANLDTVHKSMTLLKNDNSTLPLSLDGITKIAVIGPNANNPIGQLSNYYGIPEFIVSITQGIQEFVGNVSTDINVTYSAGCYNVTCPSSKNISSAVTAANDADIVFLVVGLDTTVEAEAMDRVAHPCDGVQQNAFGLPGCQEQLVDAIAQSSARVIILILMHGGGVAIPNELASPRISAILDVFYPGPFGGTGIANTVFGINVPAGRMPITIYNETEPINSLENYNMTSGLGWTYRFYKGSLTIPFGYGLSYTTFEYSNLTLSETEITGCDSIQVSASVTNTGKYDADEVAQLYIAVPPSDSYAVPYRQLEGFTRLSTEIGQQYNLQFLIDPYSLSVSDEDGNRIVLPGDYTLWVGGHQPVNWNNATQSDSTGLLQTTFTITGSAPISVSSCPNLQRLCYACL